MRLLLYFVFRGIRGTISWGLEMKDSVGDKFKKGYKNGQELEESYFSVPYSFSLLFWGVCDTLVLRFWFTIRPTRKKLGVSHSPWLEVPVTAEPSVSFRTSNRIPLTTS